MKLITMQQAKEFYEYGVIESVYFVRGLRPKTWLVVFAGPENRRWELKAVHAGVREFKTLEFAVKTVEEIGIEVMNLKVVDDEDIVV